MSTFTASIGLLVLVGVEIAVWVTVFILFTRRLRSIEESLR